MSDDPDVVLKSCSFKKAWAKFPGSRDAVELQWLNESFVDFKVLKKNLCFKVSKVTVDEHEYSRYFQSLHPHDGLMCPSDQLLDCNKTCN